MPSPDGAHGAPPRASTRYVIDTDAGVDDAVAILLALHAFPRDSVLGVTTVFGNVSLAQANHNVAQCVLVVPTTPFIRSI